jgi:hypothetical protein
VPGASTEFYTVIVEGTGSFKGVFLGTRINGTSLSIVLNSDPGNDFTGMTITILNRIQTSHNVVSLTCITDNNTDRYTPSMGENGATSPMFSFDKGRNGFYCIILGLTGWRALGVLGVDASSNLAYLYAFKSGKNKSDNSYLAQVFSARVTDAVRFTTFLRMHGCDYLAVDNVTVGTRLETLRGMSSISGFFQHAPNTANSQTQLLIKETDSMNTNTVILYQFTAPQNTAISQLTTVSATRHNLPKGIFIKALALHNNTANVNLSIFYCDMQL